jgi:hypothetical protein
MLAGSMLVILLVFIHCENRAMPYLLLVTVVFYVWYFIFGGSENDDNDYYDANGGKINKFC